MPVSDEVVLDNSPALAAIQEIGDQLTAVVSGFSADLDSALQGIPPLTLASDASQVTADIDQAITAASATPVDVQADASAVGGTIDEALNAVAAVVTPDADAGPAAAEVEGALEDLHPTVTPEVETGPAEAELGNLSKAAETASDAGDKLSGHLNTVGSTATTAAAGAGSLVGTLGKGIPIVGGFAIATAAVLTGNEKFIDSAITAQAAGQRFNQTFGEFAGEVNQVNVGNLNTDLAKLNLSLGSSTSQVRNALSNFAQLGQAAGITGGQIATSAEQLEALSARAVALNPNLGSVGDVAENMGRALARGGRFAAQFNVSLTPEEIKAKATEMFGLKDAFSQAELQVAGLQVATEKYGSTLNETITKGTQNPLIQLRQFQAELGKATTELAKPLIAPFFDLLKSAQPIILDAAKLLTSLGTVVFPILQRILSGLSPAFGALVDVLGTLIDSAGPGLIAVATQVGLILQSFGPLILGLRPIFDALGAGLGVLAQGFANILALFTTGPGAIVAFGAAILALFTLLNAHPLIAFTTALVLLIGAFKNAGQPAEQVNTNTEQLRQTMFGAAKTVAETRAKLDEYASSANDAAIKTGALSKSGEALQQFTSSGIGLDTLNKNLQRGAAGFEDLIAQATKAGQVKLKLDGVDLSADQVARLNGQLSGLLVNGRIQVTQGEQLVVALNNETAAREQAAQAQLNSLVLSGQITQAQINEALARQAATGQVTSYSAALTTVTQQQAAANAEQQTQAATLQGNAGAWVALTQAVANGTINTQNAAEAAKLLGVDVDTASKFIDQARQAVDNFVNNALTKFPTAQSVFEDMKNATNPADPLSFANNLNAATVSAQTFQTNVDTIGTKFEATAKLLQTQGPKAGAAFADAFLKASPEVQRQVEDAIKRNDEALGQIADDIRAGIGNNVNAAAELGDQTSQALGQRMDFARVTREQVDAAGKTLTDAGVIKPAQEGATTAGETVGTSLAEGMAAGIVKNDWKVQQAARDAIAKAEKAAREQAQTGSPSKLFAAIGGDLGDGLAGGLRSATRGVVAEAEGIVAAAAAATAGAQLPAPSLAALAGGTGTSLGRASGPVILDLDVTVEAAPGMTPADAAAIGDKVVEVAAPPLTRLLAQIAKA